ncbi:MAG: molybdenum cofactor biosynthesis protein MoaE [Pirellulaceae bacterium]|jgi:molybdopterin synthase catalytic subunit|nr:molybdenum cofactor biosynthesis protein MoaE [Pirellulaceae bacterium]
MDQANRSADGNLHTAIKDGAVEVEPLDWPAGSGAEVVFLGRTRGEVHPQLGPLVRLEYEVYEPMAVKLLKQMAEHAAQRFDCHAVRIVHAQGQVELGEASVVIQVATPHRAEAFDACRYLIDRLKHELPIWKKQIWRDGGSFVQGCHAHHDQTRAVPQARKPSEADTHELQ